MIAANTNPPSRGRGVAYFLVWKFKPNDYSSFFLFLVKRIIPAAITRTITKKIATSGEPVCTAELLVVDLVSPVLEAGVVAAAAVGLAAEVGLTVVGSAAASRTWRIPSASPSEKTNLRS